MRSYRREIDPCSDAYVVPRESFEALCLSATDMCGRYTQLLTWEQIVHLYELTADLDPPADFRPRYNIAPNQMAPVMRMKDGRRELAMLQWGLIPSSAKDRSMGDRLINARAESLAEEPAFRAAFRARRCLVVTGGFYEWQRKTKQPFWIGMKDGGEFDMAGYGRAGGITRAARSSRALRSSRQPPMPWRHTYMVDCR